MKSLFLFLFIFLINFNLSFANDREIELNKLFIELKTNDVSTSLRIEQKIWELWSTHPNDKKLTEMLAKGSNLVNDQNFDEAIVILAK